MTRDDIIHMAREAGFVCARDEYVLGGMLERFAALVAAAEQDRCAQIADAHASIEGIAQTIAAEIRSDK